MREQHRRLLQALRRVRERLLPRVLRRGQACSRRGWSPRGFHRVSALRGRGEGRRRARQGSNQRDEPQGSQLQRHLETLAGRRSRHAGPALRPRRARREYGVLGGKSSRRRTPSRARDAPPRPTRPDAPSDRPRRRGAPRPTEATLVCTTPRFARRPSPTIRVPCGRRGVRTSTRIGTAPTSRGRRWRTFRGTGAAGTRWWSAGWRATYRGAGPPRG